MAQNWDTEKRVEQRGSPCLKSELSMHLILSEFMNTCIIVAREIFMINSHVNLVLLQCAHPCTSVHGNCNIMEDR